VTKFTMVVIVVKIYYDYAIVVVLLVDDLPFVTFTTKLDT